MSNSDTPRHSENPFSSLNNLPLIWSSPLATQVITLATQIALDIGLNQALQGSDSAKLIENFLAEIFSLTQSAVTLLKEKSVHEYDVTKPYPSEPSVSQTQENSTPMHENDTAVDEPRKPPQAYLVSKSHTRKMETVITVLSSFRFKADNLRSVLHSVQNMLNSFHWRSLLHYDWSTSDSRATIRTLGASLSYGYHYTGSATRLVLTPVTEKSLCFLLGAIRQGSSSLIVGKEVRKFCTAISS